MDEQKEKFLMQYLDCELSDEQEQQALHMIADDAEMRSMLHFERMVQASVPDIREPDFVEVPAGFRDTVMRAIEARQQEQQEESASAWERAKEVVRSLWLPTTFRLRPVYGMCAALLTVVLVGWGFYSGLEDRSFQNTNIGDSMVQAVSRQAEQVWTRFVYIDKEAESVAVAGDFSNWEPIELSKKMLNGEQVWTGLVPMQKGEHRYMFVKNGKKWVTDPLATTYQNDGFGNKNAVLYL